MQPIEIFYHVNLFDIEQILTARYAAGREEYIHTTIESAPAYLAEYVIQEDRQYKIYLSGLQEYQLLPIKEQILKEVAVYYGADYAGVEVEII